LNKNKSLSKIDLIKERVIAKRRRAGEKVEKEKEKA
jgi:hypothetical protein